MNDMSHNKKEQRKKLLQALSFFSQIAITMASCVLIGVILGSLLDRLFGTAPTLLLIFSFLGVGAAIKSLFDMGKSE
ncbi:MAG: AtpZ/AtpI family protein [Clostridia bacterium]|nr:AtpZ/AtpI family protein [Clostridia bacterium]